MAPIGQEQDVNTLANPITYDDVTEVRNAIKVGRMYNVTLKPAASGKYATVEIVDSSTKKTPTNPTNP